VVRNGSSENAKMIRAKLKRNCRKENHNSQPLTVSVAGERKRNGKRTSAKISVDPLTPRQNCFATKFRHKRPTTGKIPQRKITFYRYGANQKNEIVHAHGKA
jgi:hypothetical protein